MSHVQPIVNCSVRCESRTISIRSRLTAPFRAALSRLAFPLANAALWLPWRCSYSYSYSHSHSHARLYIHLISSFAMQSSKSAVSLLHSCKTRQHASLFHFHFRFICIQPVFALGTKLQRRIAHFTLLLATATLLPCLHTIRCGRKQPITKTRNSITEEQTQKSQIRLTFRINSLSIFIF